MNTIITTNSAAKNLLSVICSEHDAPFVLSDAKTALQELREYIENETQDFTLDLDGMEFRIIHKSSIWDIYVDAIKDLVEDCYETNLPDFVAIDWQETARNCHVDGYGHTFSGYDGSEIEEGDYFVFRTN